MTGGFKVSHRISSCREENNPGITDATLAGRDRPGKKSGSRIPRGPQCVRRKVTRGLAPREPRDSRNSQGRTKHSLQSRLDESFASRGNLPDVFVRKATTVDKVAAILLVDFNIRIMIKIFHPKF